MGENLLTYLYKEYIDAYNSYPEGDKQKATMLRRINILIMKYSTHYELNSATVLENMPDDWLLSQPEVLSFITQSVSKSDFVKKNMKCKKQLGEHDLQNSRYRLAKAERAWVRITERDKCSICNKNIRETVFDVYPNGVIVDHTCMNKNSSNICPVTGQDFLKTFNF